MVLVGCEGKQLLICTSYARTSVLPMQESCDPFLPFFLVLSNLRKSTDRFISSFSSFARFGVREYFPSHAAPYRVLLELTYFSEALVWIAKTAIVGVKKQRAGEKSGRKSGRRIVKRATRALDNGRDPQLVELFVLSVRTIATAIRGKGVVNFSTKLPFSSSFSLFRSFPLPVVSRERIISRYELGIYNYTGAVIGFPPFFPPSFSPTLSPSFFGKHRSVPRFSLYRKAD